VKSENFRVRQTSAARDGGVWDWKMWIEPLGRQDIAEVRSVTYGLHPAFPSPNRVIRTVEGGFCLDMQSTLVENQTWGRFEVRITIVLAGGRRETYTQMLDLRFAPEDPTSVPDLLPLPANADYALSMRYYKFLKRKSAFGYAREALDHAGKMLRDDSPHGGDPEWVKQQRRWISQQRALCTYKDPSLPTDTRLLEALEILKTHCGLDLERCDDPETLGLGGAIYKRLWDIDRARAHLELALAYYRRGYQKMLEPARTPEREADANYDGGAFTGANVIYLCELLALEITPPYQPGARSALVAESYEMRQKLVRDLPELLAKRPGDWWLSVTLLDAYFGLACRYPTYRQQALDQAHRVAQIEQVSPWEQQSTGSQLLRSARLQRRLGRGSAADIESLLVAVVNEAFRGQVNTDHLWFEGKLGLALSGGGFRASLFHIGVLARLAELDLLRHVEVLSCVSGGSIVGAHYYLLLRKLLQDVADGEVRREHYITLVQTLLEQFMAGVQKNIRMRLAAGWIANLRMIFQPNAYSRSQRLGSLYEKYLYRQVSDDEGACDRWVNEIFIVPRSAGGGHEDGFSPRVDNWRRGAKVPTLVLNATTLNTGRNWQFTASYMGEPQSYGTTVDSTERLDAVYFSEAPEKWRQYRLGYAVAASSCVPGVFTPIVIPDLFTGRTVRLVDGGVHDNQGTRALLDQDCDALVVSDASGQMESATNPSQGELGVVLRSNSVLQARVRIAQHQELQARDRASLLRKLVYLHLRKTIESPVQRAAGLAEAVADQNSAGSSRSQTEYGIERGVQGALSSLRTDLDSFTDREGLCLMYSGYKMAERYLGVFDSAPSSMKVAWRFEEIACAAGGEDQPGLAFKSLLRHLQAGAHLAFKVWRLNPILNAIRLIFLAAVGVGALTGLGYLVARNVHVTVNLAYVAKGILYAIVPIGLGMVFPVAKAWIARLKAALNPGAVISRIAIGVVMASVGWFICRLHLWFFDWIFVELGRVKSPKRTE
jgi:predicted acylesterase/phospholipase RssA